MALRVAIPKEVAANEKRVAIVPEVASKLMKMGLEVMLEQGAGLGAHFDDSAYEGATIVENPAELYQNADIILKVQPPSWEEAESMKADAVLIGLMQPHLHTKEVAALRDRKVTSFALELVPRITRAQSMDVLSSQATVAGYKAALIAASSSDRFFPMLTTAAGTIRPAKVLVIGAGVAGLQAIATARRLGAIVEGYDVRPATREQVQSLGAKFVEMPFKAEAEGGYARELTDEERQQQQETLAKHVAAADAVITTAAIPGRPSPKIIPAEMVEGMKSGAVIVDLAAEGGGNCELCRPGESYTHGNGVLIEGPLNVSSRLAVHASEMYAKNLLNFITPLINDGAFAPDWEDEIVKESLLTRDGEVTHQPTRDLLQGDAS